MNKEELQRKVRSAAYELHNTGVAISPVDLFMKIGILSKKDYEDWRMGRVPYLEKICQANLSKLSVAMKELRNYAQENNLKPSKTAYMKWGKGKHIKLRFSKYNNPKIEEAYSTHYVDKTKAAELKQNIKDKQIQTTDQNGVMTLTKCEGNVLFVLHPPL